jgi:ATP-dependent exoDNAse (exonuclease V) beta subunit
MTRTAPPLADAAARRRIATDLDRSLFVEAAAGTGKTTALVSRLVAVLRSGRSTLDRIVAVTFTEKAAGEMKLRLREEIERCRQARDCPAAERARFVAALSHLEIARIGTIHAFCGDLLREHPVEAGLDPRFEVVADDQARGMLDAAFDGWFERILDDPPEGVRRVLRRRPRRSDDEGPRGALRAAAYALAEHRDFPAPWTRGAFDRDAAIDRIVAELADIAPLARSAFRESDWLAKSLGEIGRFVREMQLLESVRSRDHDGLEASLRELARAPLWRWRGGGAWYGRELPRQDLLARRDGIKAALEELLEEADAVLAALLRDELRPVVAAYQERKRREGKVDFLDLLIMTRDLVRERSEVRRDLQGRFTHYFVDEFQDTDPLQVEILMLLCADDPEVRDHARARPGPGKLFIVGDPKQSIYRFRRANVQMYQETRRRLEAAGAEVLQLTTSFRSAPSIQAAVNGAFASVMRGSDDGSQAEYVALRHHRAEPAGRPAVIALPVPRPYSRFGKITQYAIEESFPQAAAAFVDWLVRQSGWTVTERGGEGPVPVQERHVCLLFRRFRSWNRDVTRPYVQALEARRMPHVLMGGRSFHDREEVLALRNALAAVEWPDDALRVYATLRGPLFSLGDDALLAFRHRVGSLHPLRRLEPEEAEALDPEQAAVAEGLAILRRMHVGRNRRPVAETISRLLGAVRAHAGIAIWPTGEQALANCLRLIDRAHRFERRGAASFRAFVERLEEEADRGETEEAPVVEEGTEGVRIMTVHKAKGLEFPVVILADPTCNAVGRNPSHHVDPQRGIWAEPLCGAVPRDLRAQEETEWRREFAEATRLAYVAATRARDLLVVPVVGDVEPDPHGPGWLDVLGPSVYPAPGLRRGPRAAAGCPEFGDDTVLDRPGEVVARGLVRPVAPGLHASQTGNAVVWWDPRALDLDREEGIGLRQQEILRADQGRLAADHGVRAHEAWSQARSESLRRGATPSLTVHTATALASDPAPPEWLAQAGAIEVQEIRLARGERPGGTRFGTLVHATLASIPLSAGPPEILALARAQARVLGATADEIEWAAAAVGAALQHEILRRAAASQEAGELRREAPLLLRIGEREVVEGVVDLAFRAAGETAWTVVDFKTERELAPRRAAYQRQVQLYCRAIAEATGAAARGILMVV